MKRRILAALSIFSLLALSASAQSIVTKGSADVSRYILLVDSADGTPETAATITGLDLQYTRDRATPATKVDATALAATNTAHTDNRCIEIDATSSPGLYRCDWPDAAFATGVDKVLLVVTATGIHPAVEEVQLVDFDPEDGVRMGLTALPNAVADAAGGLPISDAGGLDLDTQIGTDIDAILVDTADMQPKLGTVTDLGAGATLGDNLADMAGGTFSSATDSLEDIRDRGDAAWTTGGGSGLSPLASGTAQGGTSTTIQLASGETFGDDILNNQVAKITSGTGAGQARYISDYVGATDTATVSPIWQTNPSTDSVYEVVAGPAFVAAMGADAITSASIATDAIGTDEMHADVIVDAAEMRAAVGLASANLDTQLSTIDNFLDTEVAAILVDTGTTLDGALATVDSNVDAILVDTGTTLDAALAVVDGNVDAILVDTGTTLDNLVDDLESRLGTPSDFGSGTSTVAANLEDLADNGTAVYDRSTESLQAIRDRGDAAWTTGAGGTPPQLLQSTTIATLASQTSFTLTAGSADDDAYNDAIAVVTDQSTSTQKAVGTFSDYTGSTKTVTLSADPAIFTMAVGDTVDVIAALGSSGGGGLTQQQVRDALKLTPTGGAPSAGSVDEHLDDILTDTGTTLDGKLDTIDNFLDTEVAAILADTGELQTDWVDGGRLDLILDARASQASVDAVDNFVDTEVAAILVDTGTTLQAELDGVQSDTEDIQTRLPAALVGGKMDSDATSVSSSATAAATLESMMDVTIIEGAAIAGTLSTTQMSTNLTEATSDHFIGLVLTWTSGALVGQSTVVTDYDGTTKVLTFTATTETPGAGDTFVLR